MTRGAYPQRNNPQRRISISLVSSLEIPRRPIKADLPCLDIKDSPPSETPSHERATTEPGLLLV